MYIMGLYRPYPTSLPVVITVTSIRFYEPFQPAVFFKGGHQLARASPPFRGGWVWGSGWVWIGVEGV